ncbi:MAG: SDR family oxidoreductase [Bacteroidetes bacterium]|nr:SDR family oxidoreductase [Bacteroidota bacterium]HET6244156.1 SDR family oxidoreductase [Bacteroidia bacterium]
MKKTVFITGSSAGIGKATAVYFLKNGWNVVASMRSPENETELINSDSLIIARLDVCDSLSIKQSIELGLAHFGRIDVLVNNAGYALTGPFEDASKEQIQRQFQTNVIGLFDVCRAILPHFRTKRSGTIINVASVGGRLTFPFYSLYHSTKWAVEGFSESLQHELLSYNIKVKVIEPGPIKTEFYSRSMDFSTEGKSSVYEMNHQKAIKNMQSFVDQGGTPAQVAKVIYSAAISNSNKLRYSAGTGAGLMLFFRKIMPDSFFNKIINWIVMK